MTIQCVSVGEATLQLVSASETEFKNHMYLRRLCNQALGIYYVVTEEPTEEGSVETSSSLCGYILLHCITNNSNRP